MGSVGDLALDLDATVDRAGMHDERVGLDPLHPSLVQPEERGVFAQAREHRHPLALVLDAQEVDHVGVAQGFLEVPGHPAAELLEDLGHERRRPAQRDLRAQLEQRPDVGPGHAAVEDVSEDGDVEPGDTALVLADGEGVEQALGRMLVGAVPGVDDVGAGETGEVVGRATGAVAEDDDVRVERLEVADGVAQGLALLEGAGLGREVDDIRAEPDRRELEADARAGARLDEEIHDRLATERRHPLDGASVDGLERSRRVEDDGELLGGQRLQVEQMSAGPGHLSGPKFQGRRPGVDRKHGTTSSAAGIGIGASDIIGRLR